MRLSIVLSSILLASYCFALQMNSSTAAADLRVKGKVLQEPGDQPIRKATVQLTAEDEHTSNQYAATTDAEGLFTIEDAKPGTYMVTVEHPGFIQSPANRRATSISLQSGQDVSNLVLHMQSAGVISGTIVDVDGDPMRNVSVSATRAGTIARGLNQHDWGNAATNDLGQFRISDLRAGRYLVTANPPQTSELRHAVGKDNVKEQVVYVQTYYPGTLDKNEAVPVEVHSGGETPVNFGVLTSRAYRVAGTVTGLPNGGITKIMLESRGREATQLDQDVVQDGRFEFPSVVPGSYTARLLVATFGGDQPGMQMLSIGQSIEVSNADVEGLRLRPEPGGEVRGQFHMDTGQKFDWKQLTVALAPMDEGGSGIRFIGPGGAGAISGVGSDGTFELKSVPGGLYQLVVGARSDNLRNYFTKAINLSGRDVSDSGFQPGPGTYLEVILSANGATIEGMVTDEKGQSAARVTALCVPSAEHRKRADLYQRAVTDAKGRFALPGLNPGEYSVFAFEEPPADLSQPGFLKSFGPRGEQVKVSEGSRVNVILKLIPADVELPEQ
jgi:protocatechuate 3,4-dioxygenase beta subunit